MNEDRCVCCGEIIPEGWMVCTNCNQTEKTADCKYCKDEICVNADCPMCCDYCPVPDDPGVCRYEDRDNKQRYPVANINLSRRIL